MPTDPEKNSPDWPAPLASPGSEELSSGLTPGEDFTAPPGSDEGVAAAIQKLQAENRQLTDQLLRKQAEVENVRKRLSREKEEFQQYSLLQTVESLLPVLDGFELALQTGGSGDEYRKGVELIYQQLRNALQRLGLEAIESKGGQFNPYMHEAVTLVETDEFEDHQVLEEFQRGYLFKNRLLRPARVKVAQRPAAETSPSSSDSDAKPE